MSEQRTTARQRWVDAVWDSDLAPTHRLVALAHAKYAGAGVDDVWVSWDELRRVTGYSRDTIARAIKALRNEGWLVVTAPASQHRSTRWALRVPQQSDSQTSQQSDYRTTGGAQQSDDRTPGRPSGPTLRPQQSGSRTRTTTEPPAAGSAVELLTPYGFTDDERSDFISYLKPKNLPALLRALAARGELDARVADWRLTNEAQRRSRDPRYPTIDELRLIRAQHDAEIAAWSRDNPANAWMVR